MTNFNVLSVELVFRARLTINLNQVKVQHILVESESQAVEIRKKISKEGLETFGKYAQTYSTCGSAKKAPDAKLAQVCFHLSLRVSSI